MRNSDKYAAVIVTSVPHKCVGTGDNSSLVANMRNTPGYPEVIHDKALSKSSFKAHIEQLIEQGLVAA